LPAAGDAKVEAASDAFNVLFVRKMPADVMKKAVERTEVCGPFGNITRDLIYAPNLKAHSGGVEEATYFVSSTGRVAIALLVNEECELYIERGFEGLAGVKSAQPCQPFSQSTRF